MARGVFLTRFRASLDRVVIGLLIVGAAACRGDRAAVPCRPSLIGARTQDDRHSAHVRWPLGETMAYAHITVAICQDSTMSIDAVAAALGGKKVLRTEVHSEFDLATVAMEGLAAEAAAKIVENGLLRPEELYKLVIPRRTFDRRLESHQPLTVVESDRLLRAARVIVRAIEALGSAEKASNWLRTANRALRGEIPMSMLETDYGARMVERILGRIEHGVYS
jgi:putative toxin-antitoxin system antitoxin component (TIGR02293 family)